MRDLLRVLYLPAEQYVSSLSGTASVSVSPISTFRNGRHPRSFYQACGPTPRYESSVLQNLLRNAAAGLPEKRPVKFTVLIRYSLSSPTNNDPLIDAYNTQTCHDD